MQLSDDLGDRKIHLVITGKGPNKEKYRLWINAKRLFWKKLKVDQIWLEIEDYPKMLAVADLGICLHYSSSGLDLPMKVIDMYGACLPVVAINYRCIKESVKENYFGWIFDSEAQLKKIIKDLIWDFNKENYFLQKYRNNIRDLREKKTWKVEWDTKVKPIIENFR